MPSQALGGLGKQDLCAWHPAPGWPHPSLSEKGAFAMPAITQQTELKPHDKVGGILPQGNEMQFCKENYACPSLTFKRGLQLSLRTSLDNATKCLARHLNEA